MQSDGKAAKPAQHGYHLLSARGTRQPAGKRRQICRGCERGELCISLCTKTSPLHVLTCNALQEYPSPRLEQQRSAQHHEAMPQYPPPPPTYSQRAGSSGGWPAWALVGVGFVIATVLSSVLSALRQAGGIQGWVSTWSFQWQLCACCSVSRWIATTTSWCAHSLICIDAGTDRLPLESLS